jgi:hypothetical protein
VIRDRDDVGVDYNAMRERVMRERDTLEEEEERGDKEQRVAHNSERELENVEKRGEGGGGRGR